MKTLNEVIDILSTYEPTAATYLLFDDSDVPLLQQLLNGTDEYLQKKSVYALAALAHHPVAANLLTQLAQHPDVNLRIAVTVAAPAMPAPLHFTIVSQTVNDPHLFIKQMAAQQLSSLLKQELKQQHTHMMSQFKDKFMMEKKSL